ncbi:Ankyrin repeat-containing domain, partial [Trinorchestia longiramus]
EELLRFTLVQRLDSVEASLQAGVQTGGSEGGGGGISSPHHKLKLHTVPNFEDVIVSYCQRLSRCQWLPSDTSVPDAGGGGGGGDTGGCGGYRADASTRSTLAHIIASLGYTRVLTTLLRWREDSPSLVLDAELDAMRRDSRGRTPLACAAAKGHFACARVLYYYSPQAIDSLDTNGRTPVQAAARAGVGWVVQRGVEPLRPSLLLPQDPELSVHSEEARSRSGVCPGRVVSAHSHSLDCSVAGGANQGSGDSVFLRPSPRRNDLRKHRNLSVDLPLSAGEASDGQQLRPLSTFGVAMNVSPTPAPLEQRGSEWGLASVGGRRPRLIKRPSVDSGISLSHEDPFKRASLDSGLDGLQKHVRSAGCNQASGPGEVNTEILPDDLLSSGLFDLLPAAVVATSAAVAAAGTPSATHAGAAAVADMESTMVEEESATASSSKGSDVIAIKVFSLNEYYLEITFTRNVKQLEGFDT